jgi:hypothetical protein
MRTFENPDLYESAMQIVCLSSFDSTAVLLKTLGFSQLDSKSYHTQKPRFLDYPSVLMKLLAIRLGCQSKSCWPGRQKGDSHVAGFEPIEKLNL